MEVRDLETNIFDRGINELNLLRITNMNDYLERYACKNSMYKSPFEVLADLEEKIKLKNNPEEIILCSYKSEGDVIFRLAQIRIDKDNRRIVEYEFDTFIS